MFIYYEGVRKEDKMRYRDRRESRSYLQGPRWKNPLLKGSKGGERAVLLRGTRLGWGQEAESSYRKLPFSLN